MNEIITLNDVITASGKYPERLKHLELTEEVKNNIKALLVKVNAFLHELKITKVSVSSGFRPSAVNAATPGAAKKSLHQIGKAVDIVDINGELDKLFSAHPDLMRKYDLFLEDPNKTPTWAHLDIGIRADRPTRIFFT